MSQEYIKNKYQFHAQPQIAFLTQIVQNFNYLAFVIKLSYTEYRITETVT